MRQILFVIVICTTFSCTTKIQLKENTTLNSENLLGNWKIEEPSIEWKVFYPTLIFMSDSTLMIPTRGDTIIHCKYTLKDDSLFLYLKHQNMQLIGKSRILELDSALLRMSNILSENEEVLYYRE